MRIISKPQLNTRTTLRLGGEALAEVWIEEQKDWDFLPQFLEREGGRPYVLGQGSNVLAASGQLPIVLIRLENSRSLIEVSQERDTVRIQAGCGMGLPRLMRWLQVYGLSGLEGLIGVPGSLGGAVAMNAGAYGCETAQRIKRCQFWTPEEGLFWKDSSAIDISYRHLSPGGKPTHRFWVATRVDLELIREEPKTLRTKMRHYYLQ
jgi:UDP-N-acetylmuramate dehydrogenase